MHMHAGWQRIQQGTSSRKEQRKSSPPPPPRPPRLVLEEVVVQVALKAARKLDGGGLPLHAVGEGQRAAAHDGLRALAGQVDLNDLRREEEGRRGRAGRTGTEQGGEQGKRGEEGEGGQLGIVNRERLSLVRLIWIICGGKIAGKESGKESSSA